MSVLLYEIRVLVNMRLASLADCRRVACAPRIFSFALVNRSFITNEEISLMRKLLFFLFITLSLPTAFAQTTQKWSVDDIVMSEEATDLQISPDCRRTVW